MTLNQFLALDYQSRLRATNNAVCVGGRSDEGHMVLLYQLDSFYVEVFYNKTHNYISKLNGFDDTDLLEPYLKKIEISLMYD